jgi:BMFP domain-containing protein YqiC
MEHQPHFGSASDPGTTEAVRILSMIADIKRTVQLFDFDVVTEEQRCGVFDRADAQYSILARTIAARSENLKATIAALEARLRSTSSVVPKAGTTAPETRLRSIRRNASPRRLNAWLRLKSSAGGGSNPFAQA